ncbi:bifunctional glutamate N-acetyltransferase/amino-acid acetyltransferase ArgJ [Azospirillum sp. RWY-5-1]|uniref:Arginine biosynthesis bifunctional protein ArgJ n=1 Tax=Azospirillum oleiclasticum TaxID=2735135 RepID=A0ABX2TJY3_9PROT|nr:bifunctional glutamate N-acetyltransferase/amino-acid acetyltransferase ArgJ [Azospirillum oleiclasticum]NYZ17298.1 bifunctional glutamate N-acetyltransferase/amino-acid acetyltransferase ArgJ [Azospirillum oleiclasticum]NYZ23418.1 bifunctional glutamate N-acetyltransferase/amino-acid acetyltransferase ArgJ [Azospirillum oleiclasticum]
MALPVSPLAPAAFPTLPPIPGVRLAVTNSGIRYKGRDDLLLAVLDEGTTVAGVLTKSLTCSAPVVMCRDSLKGGTARALVVNAGNANAFTGKAGDVTTRTTIETAAGIAGCDPLAVFTASTGVIGQPLAPDAIARSLGGLADTLANTSAVWEAAARAIMTTDTFPKGSVRTAEIGGTTVTISGFCKGSGMIAPDMATMLGFLFTDAAIPAPALQAMLSALTERTFNSLTVDGDTSTSDTVLLFATGKAGNPVVTDAADPALADFRRALEEVMRDLSHQIVRDGEGATKFVTIDVVGADSDAAAKRIALTIANSPLVKTAIAGEDANWGRIVMAVGKAGERAERDLLKISVGGTLICADGMEVPGYDEAPVAAHMKGKEIDILVDIGLGNGKATVWTCDLTHGYIDINGSYRS